MIDQSVNLMHVVSGAIVNPGADGLRDIVLPALIAACKRVLVKRGCGACHGTSLVDGRCPKCGIAPDMQSTELWAESLVTKRLSIP